MKAESMAGKLRKWCKVVQVLLLLIPVAHQHSMAGEPSGFQARLLQSSRTFTFSVKGMDCAGCAKILQASLPEHTALPQGCSMQHARVSFEEATAQTTVSCASASADGTAAAEAVVSEIELQGFQARLLQSSRTFTFSVKGMDCAGCAKILQASLPEHTALPQGCSMQHARVSFEEATAQTTVSCSSASANDTAAAEAVVSAIELQGFQARLLQSAEFALPRSDHGDWEPPGALASWVLDVAEGLAEVCPWLLLGIAATLVLKAVSSALLPNNTLHKHLILGDTDGVWALVSVCSKATLLGLVCPLCSCGAVPLAVGLAQAGASPAAVLAFLLAAQSSGLDSAVITMGLFGPEVALQRLLGASLIALSAGLAVGKGGSGLGKTGESGGDVDRAGEKISRPSLRAVAIMCAELMPGLFVGVMLTSVAEPLVAALRSALPSSGTGTVARQVAGTVSLRIFAVLGALPLQACEHSVAAFARALEKAGASPGTAFAFLLVAPATNIATVALLLRHSGSKGRAAVCRATVAIICVAVALSFAVDSMAAGAPHSGVSAAATVSSAGGLLGDLCSYKMLRWVCLGLVCVLVAGSKLAPPAAKTKTA
jgi:uncharacterized protein